MVLIFEKNTSGDLPRRFCPICGKTMTFRICLGHTLRYCESCDVFLIPEPELEKFLSDCAGKSVALAKRWQSDPKTRMLKLPACRDNNVPMPSFVLGKEMPLFACRCPQCGDVCIGQNELNLFAEFVKNE
jgi:Zn-finger nucleic acid-binding protein